jgi:arabinofuranan 3-O-arabinosyltransferase
MLLSVTSLSMDTRIDVGDDPDAPPATLPWRRTAGGPLLGVLRWSRSVWQVARGVLVGWRAEGLAYALLTAAIALPVLLTDRGLLPVDTSAHLYLDPARALGNALETWLPAPTLGQANYNTGIAPLAAAFWLVRHLIGPLELAMRLWRLALLLVAATGAARLFHHLGGAAARRAAGEAHWTDRTGRVVAAAVYVCNPYMVVGGATSPILVPAAVLPWLVLALHRGVWERASAGGSSGSWRWPAAFGIAVFCMTGVNAGVVPAFMLLAVPCYLAWARLAWRVPWRVLVATTGRCALAAMAVSAYWLTPAALASGVGVSVANFSESIEAVAHPSSYAETLRGLGFWVTYGRTGPLPWQQGFTGYLTNPMVILASFAVPVAAAVGAMLARARLRLLGALLLGLAVPLMVGLFPPQAPSPLGRALGWVFQHVPGAIALRTTNKAGALAMLGLALLIAPGAVEVARRLRGSAQRAAAAALALAVTAVAVLPAWTGGLYPVTVDIPEYWRAAARDLNASTPNSRVLLVPDQQNALYRWGNLAIEDVSQSLLTRNTAVRSSVLVGASVEQANYLAASAAPLQPGWNSGSLASMARYIGAADVLVRHDLRWEEVSDRHPSEVDALVRQEPGLTLAGTYGRPGENTRRPVTSIPVLDSTDADASDSPLTPLVRYLVDEPKAVLRTEPAGDTIMIDGDNFALPTMARFGLLAGEPPFRLLGSLDRATFQQALRDGDVRRIVLSDSNRRRKWTTSRLVDGYTPTLAAGDPIRADEPSLSLFSPDEQSVTALTGARRISASRVGSLFGFRAGERALFAFDGDPSTSWTTGDFDTAVGQSVTIELDGARQLGSVTLRPAPTEPARVAAARVQAGDRVAEVRFADDQGNRPVVVPLGGVRADRLTVTITKVRGTAGFSPVGFAEIAVPGVEVTETVRLPQALRRLTGGMGAQGRALLAQVPLDVVLKRQGVPRGSVRDEERAVDRTFWLPDERTFTLSGKISLGPGLPDPAVDALTGARTGSVVATSSSRYFEQVEYRASRALDDDRTTAWSPATRDAGEWIEVSFPRRRVDNVVIAQPPVRPGTAHATRALLSLDGDPPIPVTLGPGATRVDFPARWASRARLTISKVSEFGDQARITELRIGSLRLPHSSALQRLRSCVAIGTLDGKPLRARLRGTVGDLDQPGSLDLQPCQGSRAAPGAHELRLGPGEHRLRAAEGWLLDELRLASAPKAATRDPSPSPPSGQVLRTTRTTTTLTTRQADAPYYLVLGQGFDRGWSATMDGRPLGPPILLDGYSTGWRIDDLGPHRFEITYGPQRPTAVAQAFSLVSMVVLGTIWLRPRPRRLGRAPRRSATHANLKPRGTPRGPARRSAVRRWARAAWRGALRVAGWTTTCAALWLAGGVRGLLLGAALVGWDVIGRPTPRHLLAAAVALLSLVPLAVLLGGLPVAGTIGPELVARDQVAHVLAGAGLALLVIGVLRAVREDGRGDVHGTPARPSAGGGSGPGDLR